MPLTTAAMTVIMMKMCPYLSEQVSRLAQSATALRPEPGRLGSCCGSSRVHSNHRQSDASDAISQYHGNSFLRTYELSVNFQHYVAYIPTLTCTMYECHSICNKNLDILPSVPSTPFLSLPFRLFPSTLSFPLPLPSSFFLIYFRKHGV